MRGDDLDSWSLAFSKNMWDILFNNQYQGF